LKVILKILHLHEVWTVFDPHSANMQNWTLVIYPQTVTPSVSLKHRDLVIGLLTL
jgi:hypothetical protein